MNTIIEQLKTARKAKNLKQSELGLKLGLPQSHISKIEKGDNDPRLSTVTDMGRLLDHELMLIPRHLVHHVSSLVTGKDEQKPMWIPDEEDDQ